LTPSSPDKKSDRRDISVGELSDMATGSDRKNLEDLERDITSVRSTTLILSFFLVTTTTAKTVSLD